MSLTAPSPEDLTAALNEPQRAAVTHGAGPLLILAGAGSGKTRVLTHRLAWLVATGQARAHEILAITFTNKAAQEMRGRVELLTGLSTRGLWVMTFHSACARMLRIDGERIGYGTGFTIFDQDDSPTADQALARRARAGPEEGLPRRAVQGEISRAKNALLDSGRVPRDGRLVRRRRRSPTCTAPTSEACERQNAMDFDDLLVSAGQRCSPPTRSSRALVDQLQARARRRVPGHQPRPVQAR